MLLVMTSSAVRGLAVIGARVFTSVRTASHRFGERYVNITANLIGGVVSSLLAVLLIELYRIAGERSRHRALRKMLNNSRHSAVIIPNFSSSGDDRTGALMAVYDAFALAHVLESCNRIRTVTLPISAGRLPEDMPGDLISVGGPVSNPVTAAYLRNYCAGISSILPDSYSAGFKCGGTMFEETKETTWAFIVRLSPRVTGRSGGALLLWGATAVATASAAYYLSRHANKLPWAGDAGVFAAIKVNQGLGYRSVLTRPVDISKEAVG